MSDELSFLTAVELLDLYRAGELSPVEVTRQVLDRIAAINPRVNALYFVDEEGALAAARASEARWRRREPQGLLDGVSVTLKDSVHVAGMPTPHGTRAIVSDEAAGEDAPATRRLREHGAILLGKTTMPDFGMIPSGLSSLHGVTRNPWNLERSSGGSSAGAGAAVAAGMGALAIGSDIGGSIRIPAAFCGITGLKPSYGRVPLVNPWTALVAGPMARSVSDAALLLQVISGPDTRDYTALPWENCNYLEGIEGGICGLRIGLLLDIGFGLPVQAEVAERIKSAAAVLAGLGAIMEPMAPIFENNPEPDFDRMMQAYAWADFAALPAAQQEVVLPTVATWCSQGEGMSAAELTSATYGIGQTRRRVIAACAQYHYVISPTMAIEAFAAESPWAPNGTQHNPFCFPFNLSEQPALSVCCGFTSNGLPVGLQIVGRRFDDAGVLRVGRAYEGARPAMPTRPPI